MPHQNERVQWSDEQPGRTLVFLQSRVRPRNCEGCSGITGRSKRPKMFFQACSFALTYDDPEESGFARNFLTHPPTGTPRRATSPGDGLLIFLTSPSGEQTDCPSLRASDEHRFIVRVLRARRMVWLLPSRPSETARCASRGDSPGHPPCWLTFLSIPLEGWGIDLSL